MNGTEFTVKPIFKKGSLALFFFFVAFFTTAMFDVKIRFTVFVVLLIVMNLAGLGTALKLPLPAQMAILFGCFLSAMVGTAF